MEVMPRLLAIIKEHWVVLAAKLLEIPIRGFEFHANNTGAKNPYSSG